MNFSKHLPVPPACLALVSALLFGASTPVAKMLLGQLSPQLMAGLLYLGSGVGLILYRLTSSTFGSIQFLQGVRRSDFGWLAAAIVFGGIAGPLLLMIGLHSTQAAATSLLLNLEGVFTALIAWLAFKEHTNRHLILAMILIALGGVILSWEPGQHLSFSVGSLAIVAACSCWALDNNLTRNIKDIGATQVAAIKGIVGGSVNCTIALASGSTLPSLSVATLAAAIGFVSYGMSLTLFIIALRLLGTARTGAYFSTAPFAGALLSVLILHEQVSTSLLVAAILMIAGIVLNLTEKHAHEHVHPAVEHEHMHIHDKHHLHEHGPDASPCEPHSHYHVHSELIHSHPHYPDTEHRHEH